MPVDQPEPTARPSTGRLRLRRSGRQLVRVGALLTVLSLVVTLVSGFATRSMINHLQTNAVELLDGSVSVPLTAGTERTLYVTGGLIAPGELVPTPLEQISCEITGPDGEPTPFVDRTADRVGVDLLAARVQVVGHFTAQVGGAHLVECEGRGVVLSPELEPASVLARLGGLSLGSLGTVLGLTMLLLGGVLLLLRRGEDDAEREAMDDDLPPEEGAEEWWDETQAGPGRGSGEAMVAGVRDPLGDDYVDLSEEELAAMSEDEIEARVASGALVFVDEDAADRAPPPPRA